jgi:hypothetical protein
VTIEGEIRMDRKRLKRRVVFTTASCVVVLALAVLAPNIAAFGWHVIHSGKQQFGDYEIAVPSSFILQRTSTGIRLVRAKTTFSSTLYEFESVELNQAPGQVDIEKWRAGALQTLSNAGDKNAKGFDINIGGSPSACIEREQDDPSVRTIVLCKSTSNLTTQYFGNDGSLASMKDVLQTVQRRPA